MEFKNVNEFASSISVGDNCTFVFRDNINAIKRRSGEVVILNKELNHVSISSFDNKKCIYSLDTESGVFKHDDEGDFYKVGDLIKVEVNN